MDGSAREFRILGKLGEGTYADVYKVKSMRDQRVFAQKHLKKRYRSIDEAHQLIEVRALRLLSKHPNIVSLHELVYDSSSGHVGLICELMDMSLLDYLQQNQSCDEPTTLGLVYQLTKAISYVHSKGIFHRDIKPENCLINSDPLELKLADFGSVSSVADRTVFTEYVATRWYRAPECILTSGEYGPSVDVWAIGCVLFEILTGRPLFPGKHQMDQLNKIHAILGTPSRDILAQFQGTAKVGFAFRQSPKQNFRHLLPDVSEAVVDLIEKMLVYDPAERITAADALKHAAFAELARQDAAAHPTEGESRQTGPVPPREVGAARHPRPPAAPPPVGIKKPTSRAFPRFQKPQPGLLRARLPPIGGVSGRKNFM